MAVMAIIAIMIFAIVPNLENQVPAYRLRSGARELASEIEMAQSEAVGKRKTFYIRYDFDRRSYQMLLPPAEDPEAEGETEPDPNDPLAGGKATPRPVDDLEHGKPPPDPSAPEQEGEEEEEETLDPDELEALPETILPDDIVFVQIQTSTGPPATSGRVVVPFSHLGNEGAHTIGLAVDQERETRLHVKFNPMTRTIVISEAEPQLRELDGDEAE